MDQGYVRCSRHFQPLAQRDSQSTAALMLEGGTTQQRKAPGDEHGHRNGSTTTVPPVHTQRAGAKWSLPLGQHSGYSKSP